MISLKIKTNSKTKKTETATLNMSLPSNFAKKQKEAINEPLLQSANHNVERKKVKLRNSEEQAVAKYYKLKSAYHGRWNI